MKIVMIYPRQCYEIAMKYPGIIMKIAMKYPRQYYEIAMKYPGIIMKIAMKYPRQYYETAMKYPRQYYEIAMKYPGRADHIIIIIIIIIMDPICRHTAEIMLAASSPLGTIGRDFGWGKNIIRAWYHCNKISRPFRSH